MLSPFKIKRRSQFTLSLILFCSMLFAQQGKLDLTFNTVDDGLSGDGFNDAVRTLVLQPDGNLIVGGDYLSLNGVPVAYLTRLKPDGTIDETFNTGTGFNGKIYKVHLQADGKLLVGGSFTNYDGHIAGRLIRLNTDGSFDASFSTSLGATTGIVYDIAEQPDGKIVIVGSFAKYNNVTVNRIVRLLPTGSIDASFATGSGSTVNITSAKIVASGKILIAGNFISFNGTSANRMARLNNNGSIDNSFTIGTGFNDDVNAVSIQPNGKILAGGNYTTFNGFQANRIIRLNEDGTPDPSFVSGSGFTKEGIQVIKTDSFGNIMAGGSFTGFYNGNDVNRVVFLNEDGSLKTDFDLGSGPGSASVLALETDQDGSWFIGGSFSVFDGQNQGRLAKVSDKGEHDIAYLAAGVGFDNSVLSLLPLEDKKTIVVGSFTKFNGEPARRITRLLDNGLLDSSFNSGKFGADNLVKTAVLQDDGKIILGGNFTKYNEVQNYRIVRILSDGSIDDSFSTGKGFNSQVYAMQLQSDGRLIAAGNFATYNGLASGKIVRILPDGSKDNTFNPGIGANGIIEAIAIQPDGKILAAGRFTSFNDVPCAKLVRLNPDGSIDNTFSIGDGFDKYVYTIALQSDGKIVLGGSFLAFNKTKQNRLVRLNSNGSLDTSFQSGTGFNKGDVRTLLIQPDNRIIVGGTFSGTYKNITALRLIRLFENGDFDNSFSASLNDKLFAIAIGADFRLLIGGNFNSVSGISKHRIARLKLCLYSTIWNGISWSRGFPSGGKEVTFKADFNHLTNANVCSCTIENQKTVTLLNDNTLGIEFDYSGTGTLVLEEASSLYQSDDDIINTGIIHLKRKTQPILKFDFTYWSSPVDHQKLIDLSPETLSDKYYSYNDLLKNWKIEQPSAVMQLGKGYTIRGPQSFSTTDRAIFEAVFKGIPNNGKVEIAFEKANNFSLIGNPYPSAVDASLFLKKNAPQTKGALYFWTHNTPITNLNYTADDYAVYNLLGDTATRPALSVGSNNYRPDGTITSGQAFFIKSNAAGTIVFDNSMRIPKRNNVFFKSAADDENQEEEKHRLWLNITNSEGLFKQILVGYATEASNDFDLLYDAEYMSGSQTVDFYSLCNNTKLVIQGRALPFSDSDTVKLGFKTITAGSFVVQIDHADEKLADKGIFLEDKENQQMFDLTKADYKFTSREGTFNDRFVLHFNNQTLGISTVENKEQKVYVAVHHKIIKVFSSQSNLQDVSIYDVSGKLLYDKKQIKNKSLQISNLQSTDQVLFVKTILENDQKFNSKIIF
ncbi:T9SS sorting signal type C domain-containing protein [Flavobacterium artemisiae]|uniref:T9SS sorting signal type C domain-containing protein n=1 Tax=Flavobacterium artemisiae TaxID=2126556 RepID=A0ABW4H885_9FLAO